MRNGCRRPFVACLLLVLVFHPRSTSAQDGWIEVRSPHFAVVSDAGEERARRVAAMLETIREVFTQALPAVAPREGPPLEVFAVTDQDELRELLPRFAERDPRRMPLGVYVPTTDKNFIVLLESARGENPYETVFHEYFHSLASPVIPWAPAWFHEGIAEFWENTIIKRDTVETGRPSEASLSTVRNERWMSFEELLSADRTVTNSLSPRWTTVFYAQSWLILHYVMLGDRTGRLREGITPYLQLTRNGEASVDAFVEVFGDLEDFEQLLRQYLRRFQYQALEIDKPRNIEPESYTATVLSEDQLAARRGSFFVHRRFDEEGRAALDRALQLNPDNALAHEALGLLQYRTGSPEEAKASFEKAASLNGTLFLPRYYLSILDTTARPEDGGMPRAQVHLERAVQMNPYHAPSLARLALIYGSRGEKKELALTLARRAEALSPTSPYAYVAHGVTARAAGMFAEARAAFEAALRLSPDYEYAQRELEGLERVRKAEEDERIRQIEDAERVRQYPFAGSWAFDGVRAWIQIGEDGKALHCAITANGIERRTGNLSGSEVTWTSLMPDGSEVENGSTVSIVGGELRFETELGEYMLRRVARVSVACRPIF